MKDIRDQKQYLKAEINRLDPFCRRYGGYYQEIPKSKHVKEAVERMAKDSETINRWAERNRDAGNSKRVELMALMTAIRKEFAFGEPAVCLKMLENLSALLAKQVPLE